MGDRSVRTVLMVDDNEALLRAWRRLLPEKTVLIARDLTGALAHATQIDVAIVDVWLGHAYGIDVVRALVARTPAPFVTVVSSALDDRRIREASDAGADLTIEKPESPRGIVALAERGVLAPAPRLSETLDEAERVCIARALHDCAGNVTHAADQLAIRRSTLQRKLTKYGWRA